MVWKVFRTYPPEDHPVEGSFSQAVARAEELCLPGKSDVAIGDDRTPDMMRIGRRKSGELYYTFPRDYPGYSG